MVFFFGQQEQSLCFSVNSVVNFTTETTEDLKYVYLAFFWSLYSKLSPTKTPTV